MIGVCQHCISETYAGLRFSVQYGSMYPLAADPHFYNRGKFNLFKLVQLEHLRAYLNFVQAHCTSASSSASSVSSKVFCHPMYSVIPSTSFARVVSFLDNGPGSAGDFSRVGNLSRSAGRASYKCLTATSQVTTSGLTTRNRFCRRSAPAGSGGSSSTALHRHGWQRTPGESYNPTLLWWKKPPACMFSLPADNRHHQNVQR